MTHTECKSIVLDLYKANQFNIDSLAVELEGSPARSTVWRWLAGKTEPPESHWCEMCDILTRKVASIMSPPDVAFDLALEVLARGKTPQAEALAERIIRARRGV